MQLEPPEVSQGLPKFTSTYFKSPGEPKMLHTAESGCNSYVLSLKVEDSHTTQTFLALHFIGKPVFPLKFGLKLTIPAILPKVLDWSKVISRIIKYYITTPHYIQ